MIYDIVKYFLIGFYFGRFCLVCACFELYQQTQSTSLLNYGDICVRNSFRLFGISRAQDTTNNIRPLNRREWAVTFLLIEK
jgi:hypothetical protein